MAYLQADPDRSAVRLDSTIVRAAGTLKNKGTDPALGRSRGGFGIQIHGLADRRGRPLRVTAASVTTASRPGPCWKPGGRAAARPDHRPGL